MSRIDGRKLSHQVREEIRYQVINEWLSGTIISELAVKYCTDKSCIYRWINRYKKGGMDALKTRPIKGRSPKLCNDQRSRLTTILLTKKPEDFGFCKRHWTREVVASVIEIEFKVSMHPGAVSKMLKKMGLNSSRRIRQGKQQEKYKSV